MAWRISDDQLRNVVESDPALDTAVFINMANALTDQLAKVDTTPGGIGGTGGQSLLSSAMLIQVELMLAAHFYSLRDQRYQSKSTGGASASFQGQAGEGLASTDYGRNALSLDVTGYLARINRGVHAIQIQVAETYFSGDDIDPTED
jgi:hypothetical protein